jgi:hypothetical protein
MKDLWKQTGMKTNGRKLLAVDNDDLEAVDGENRRRSHRRKRRKRACRVHRRVHSSSSSQSPKSTRSNSDACSDTSPPYVGVNVGNVASAKKPLAYSSSTEVYAEVYDQETEKRKVSGVSGFSGTSGSSGIRSKSSSSSSYRR